MLSVISSRRRFHTLRSYTCANSLCTTVCDSAFPVPGCDALLAGADLVGLVGDSLLELVGNDFRGLSGSDFLGLSGDIASAPPVPSAPPVAVFTLPWCSR